MYKIIICDDELIIRNGLKSLIESANSKLEIAGMASNGFEAYKQINDIQPEIVLMDINMPGMTGLEVIKEILPTLPLTKFIIISGYDEFEYAQQAIKLKAYDYLLKPIDKKNLFSVLENACNDYAKEKKAFAEELTNENPTVQKKAIDFIYKHYNDSELSLNTIAKQLHVSESYLTRIIKNKSNMSFSDLLTKIRMEKAISFLLSNSNLTVLEISDRIG
ncbi:MAG: two component transcriptional regulator, AraC family, partial [Bacillota bacterium]|nr:two component transcriptional regulator, AraC family [Bacillota bacterium]